MTTTIAALLTLDEVAAILRKTPAQMRWMVHIGTAPPSAKIGGRRLFRDSDVSRWVDKAFSEESAA